MNCFHFSVSLGYKTTIVLLIYCICTLWIAFIFQYLWDTKQLHQIGSLKHLRCELLSFFSIFGIQNNLHKNRNVFSNVVNCFHFSVSLGYKTTSFKLLLNYLTLWIAFIFQYLWDTKQPRWYINDFHFCCELLSFFSIFGIQNNITQRKSFTCQVVNCFHFSVSLGYKTTSSSKTFEWIELWIAFIFQYLWDTKQRKIGKRVKNLSCELLSFFSIFGIQNNWLF